MFELLRPGGIILWVIVGSGVLAFIVFMERSLHLHRARIRAEDFLKGIFNILRRRNITEALAICDETPGPVAYLVKTAILHRKDRKEDIQEAVQSASLAEVSRMERRLVVVATVAQIAPLLGLLGTVMGMLESMLMMQQDVHVMISGDVVQGMVRALVTTAGGLAVAIPCYAAFNLLIVKIDRLVLDMERAGSEMVTFLADFQSGGATVSEETPDEDAGPPQRKGRR
jgi:biopolymer transport protein ExbB